MKVAGSLRHWHVAVAATQVTWRKVTAREHSRQLPYNAWRPSPVPKPHEYAFDAGTLLAVLKGCSLGYRPKRSCNRDHATVAITAGFRMKWNGMGRGGVTG